MFIRRAIIAASAVLALAAPAKAQEFINILTGGTSGVYYPMPVLNAYRTMCLAPSPDFRRVLEDVRELRLVA